MAVESERTGGWSPALTVVLVAVLLAGALFGYDQGVISGALPLLTEDLGLSTLQAEIVTSWVTLGARVGAMIFSPSVKSLSIAAVNSSAGNA